MAHTCDECGRDDFRTATGLTSHIRAKHPPKVEGYVYGQTLQAVQSARHLTPMDDGTVAVLLDLARVIDGMQSKDPDAPMDNVTKPTYLKYASELGLTPLSRLKLGKPEDRSGSKLAELRSIRGGKAS
ncbi:MAG: hypothetical protein R6V28_06745 [Nitriliruptoraceae bacterium]